jgi:ABC-type branched-subunit amino acid transport system substrate-binding protein
VFSLIVSFGKSKFRFFRALPYILLVIALLSSCARVPVLVEEEAPPSPEVARELDRLEKADRFMQKQAYQDALKIYENYVKRFPKGPQVDTTLIKIGTAYTAMGSYSRARQAFYKVIYEYPESPLLADARLNIVLTYYKEGNFAEAIKHADAALGQATTEYEKVRMNNLIGHSHGANKEFQEAVRSYMTAYLLAPQAERADILNSVEAVIGSLQEEDLKQLIDEYGDDVPGAHLRLQLAEMYTEEDRDDEALAMLSEFERLYPEHELSGAAAELREELESRALVDRFSIGCILPLSGPYEAFGRRALSGIELALSEFSGKYHVSPVQLLIRDSRGDFSDAVQAVESLALEDGVIAIIGPMITSEAAAIRAEALKVPMITMTQKPEITTLGDYIFRNFLTPSSQVKAIARHAVEDLGIRQFAILYPNERYGISFMNRFWDELILYGADIVGVESYGPDQTDFAEPIKKLVGLHYPRLEEPAEEEGNNRFPGMKEDEIPEDDEEKALEPIIDFGAVFVPDSYKKIALIAPQFPYYDVNNVVMLGTNLWHSDELIRTARGYVQGAIVPEGFYEDSQSPEVRNFVKRFKKVFGTSPGFWEALAYDTARIAFQTANLSRVRSRRGFKSALLELDGFRGVTGRTSFDETGDVDKQIYLLKIKGSRFVQIEP